MSIDDRPIPGHPYRRSRNALIIVTVAAIAGALSVPVQIIQARSSSAARRSDIQVTTNLVHAVQDLQRIMDERARDHQERTEGMQNCLARYMELIADGVSANLDIGAIPNPCANLLSPSPSPSPR